jgi:hypothetical protein
VRGKRGAREPVASEEETGGDGVSRAGVGPPPLRFRWRGRSQGDGESGEQRGVSGETR